MGSLNPLKRPKPFEMVFLATITGLPRDREGHTSVLFLEDRCTGWVEASEVKAASRYALAKFIRRELVMRWGMPTVVLLHPSVVR